MANTISVTSTVTQAKTYLIEAPKAKLLQEVFFPTGSEDEFVTKEVLFDLDEGDFGVAPMVSKGYKNENVVTWKATAVEPPRCGLEVSIDPTDRDRQLFESLMYNAKGNRAIAFQDYKRIIAARAAERVSRKIEQLCVSVLMNNAIEGTMPKSPTDPTEVPIEIKFYDDSTGNQQRYLPANAWGQNGATPYDDICAMVQALSIHGGDPRILLISPEAYALLALDEKYQAFFKTYHSEKSVLTGDDYSGAPRSPIAYSSAIPSTSLSMAVGTRMRMAAWFTIFPKVSCASSIVELVTRFAAVVCFAIPLPSFLKMSIATHSARCAAKSSALSSLIFATRACRSVWNRGRFLRLGVTGHGSRWTHRTITPSPVARSARLSVSNLSPMTIMPHFPLISAISSAAALSRLRMLRPRPLACPSRGTMSMA